MIMRVAMSKQSFRIGSLTYLEVDGDCQQLEVMDVCCALIDDFDWFLENERYDLLLDIVSAVFKSDASAFDDWFNNEKWLRIDIIYHKFDKPFCDVVCKIYSCCAEER